MEEGNGEHQTGDQELGAGAHYLMAVTRWGRLVSRRLSFTPHRHYRLWEELLPLSLALLSHLRWEIHPALRQDHNHDGR